MRFVAQQQPKYRHKRYWLSIAHSMRQHTACYQLTCLAQQRNIASAASGEVRDASVSARLALRDTQLQSLFHKSVNLPRGRLGRYKSDSEVKHSSMSNVRQIVTCHFSDH
jgi:hypothetical protein